MKVLAFDASTEMFTVALRNGEQTLEHTEHAPRLHAQLILPTIHNLLSEAKLTLQELDAIAVGVGPGSFTGVRIACSVAKGLCLGSSLKAAPVCSLQAIAQSAYDQAPSETILATIDARMDEVYWQIFKAKNGLMCSNSDIQLTKPEAIRSQCSVTMVGSGVEHYFDRIPAKDSDKKLLKMQLSARSLLEIGGNFIKHGNLVTSSKINPLYIRNSVVNQK